MPFNGSGSFSLAEAPFVPLTTISSAAMNSDLSDIAAGLSNCLTTDGQSSMSSQLKAFAGTVLSPGYTFSTDLNTGIYRIAADNIGIACGGTKILDIGSTGINVIGAIKQNGITLLPPGLGPVPWAGSTAPSGWLLCYGQSLLRASYADLFAAIGTTYGSADSTHFNLPDMRGRVVAGKDDMGGSAAGRLTSTTMTPDGVTLGATGGEQTHTLTSDETPVLSGTTAGGNATASVNVTGYSLSGGPTNIYQPGSGSTLTSTVASEAVTVNSGGGGAHNNVQPSIITNYIIYAGV